MVDYLYLLPNRERSAFKIGVTRRPEERVREIGAPLDVDDAVFFEVPWGKAYSLEKRLHSVFAAHACPVAYGSGNTEWFDHSVLAIARRFIEQFRADLGVGGERGLTCGDENTAVYAHVSRSAARAEAWARELAR